MFLHLAISIDAITKTGIIVIIDIIFVMAHG
jgi:hypothetical protein